MLMPYSIIKTQHHRIARKIKNLRLYTATNPLMSMKHCFIFEERPSYTWIGGSDYSVEGRWFWDGYNRSAIALTARWWLPGEPNNCCGEDPEDCMCVSNAGNWNDCPCQVSYPFICEKRVFGSSSVFDY